MDVEMDGRYKWLDNVSKTEVLERVEKKYLLNRIHSRKTGCLRHSQDLGKEEWPFPLQPG